MSRSVSVELLAELQSGVPIIATCWKITRADGVVLGFTDWPYNIDYSGVLYEASGGYQRTALNHREGLNTDNMDIRGILDSASISEEDLLAEKYHNADVEIFALNPYNLAWGDIELDYGTIGEITVNEVNFIAEFRSLTHKLEQKFGNKYSRYCRHKLGSSKLYPGTNVELKCGIELEPDVWQSSTDYQVGDAVRPSTYDGFRYVCSVAGTSNDTEGEPSWVAIKGDTTVEVDGVEWVCYEAYTKEGSVTSVSSDFVFTDSSFTDIDNWYQYGVLTWTSGPNINLSFDVKSSTDTGEFVLRKNPFYTVEIGHTFKVSVGCNHILKMPSDTKGVPYTGDCIIKFGLEFNGNAKNFGGEPELPNLDRVATPADNTQ